MSSLPKKWCIKRNKENHKEVNKYFNELSDSEGYYFDSGEWHYSSIPEGKKHHSVVGDYEDVPKYPEYTPITFEQFKKHVLMEQKGKIIGYKAPYCIYSSVPDKKIEKGEMLVPSSGPYYKKESWGFTEATYFIAKEIVETWEPVYEEQEKVLIVGDKKIEVKIKKGSIEADGHKLSIESLKYLLRSMSVKINAIPWDISFPTLKLGCTTLSWSELRKIEMEYEALNN